MRTGMLVAVAFLLLESMVTPLFARSVDVITKIVPQDGASGDRFGTSIAISDSVVIVGAPYDSDAGLESGSAYLFDAQTGVQVAKLVAHDAAEADHFGEAVAIDGAVAVVGAPGQGHNGFYSGAAFLFDAVSGVELLELLPLDGATRDNFGGAVAISGTMVVIGAGSDDDNGLYTGSAYVFDSATGAQLAKFGASNAGVGDFFGSSVAIHGTTAVVGAPYHTVTATDSGEAYLFDLAVGRQVSTMFPADGGDRDLFGYSVALSEAAIIVGTFSSNDNGLDSGSAYFFDPNTGTQIKKLIPSDNVSGDHFGYSVAISGELAIAGAYGDDGNGTSAGSAYIFEVSTGAEVRELHAPDGDDGDYFGQAVGIDGDTAVVSALYGGDNGIISGAAYIFYLTDQIGPASTTVRNGSGLNATLLSGATDPVLGQSWDTDVDASGHAPSLVSLVVLEEPSSGSFLSGGEVLLDLSSALVSNLVLPHSGDSVRFSSPVPFDGSLFGFTASAQAIVFGTPGYELSNALDLVVGY